MSLDNMELPPIVLQNLFKHSLIGLKQQTPATEKKALKPFSTLGNNRKQILILVDSEETLYLPDDELNLLLGILNACKLSMEDVAILNIKKNKSVNYKTVTEALQAEKLLLFGVTPSQIELPLDFPHYQVQKYNNQLYVTAPSLSFFNDNKAEKTKLWNTLKQVFNI